MIDPGHDARQAVWELADIAHRFLAHLVEQMLDKVGEKGRLALELFHQGAAAHAGALGDRERTRAGISRFVQALDRGGEHPAARVLTPDAMRAARSPPAFGRRARFDVYYIFHLVDHRIGLRSEEHTSELQSLMRISYAVFC